MDAGVGKAERNGKIREAVERFRYSQQEVARHFTRRMMALTNA